MLLVASETGHVYTFATEKLESIITSETGQNLLCACLSPTESSNKKVVDDDNYEIEIDPSLKLAHQIFHQENREIHVKVSKYMKIKTNLLSFKFFR